MLDSQINPIHTPCKSCVFALYSNNTQTDCAIGYIEKYKNKNTEILEAYDNDKEFYIINGKKCLGYRENKWFNQFDLTDADINQKVAKYFETNILDYYMVVDLKQLNINQLDDILKQISECKIQPKKVIFIRYVDNELQFGFSKIEALLTKHAVPYIWRIQTIVDLSLNHEQILHNIISLNAKYRFVLSVKSMNNDIGRIVSQTNKVVHDDLDQFEVFSNKDHSSIIFSTIVYRFEAFHGNNLLNKPENYVII